MQLKWQFCHCLACAERLWNFRWEFCRELSEFNDGERESRRYWASKYSGQVPLNGQVSMRETIWFSIEIPALNFEERNLCSEWMLILRFWWWKVQSKLCSNQCIMSRPFVVRNSGRLGGRCDLGGWWGGSKFQWQAFECQFICLWFIPSYFLSLNAKDGQIGPKPLVDLSSPTFPILSCLFYPLLSFLSSCT